MREAYSFVANNYEDGDEIFMIGFSRGAFTARSVAGLIAGIGVLTKKGLVGLPVVYKVWVDAVPSTLRTTLPSVSYMRKRYKPAFIRASD